MMKLPIAYFQFPIENNARSSRLSPGNRQLAIGNLPRPAFTFIEVLFAVILLGIGFIMIAAVFPVAIQQTSTVSDQTQSNAVARDAIRKLQAIADSPAAASNLFPCTAQIDPVSGSTMPTVMGFSYTLNQLIGSDAFYAADRRYGWVGFYRRDSTTSPFAQVFIVSLQNPNFVNYLTLNYWQITASPPGAPTAPAPMQIPGAVANQIYSPPWAPVLPPIPPNLYNNASGTTSASPPNNPPFTLAQNSYYPGSAGEPRNNPLSYPIPTGADPTKFLPLIPSDYYPSTGGPTADGVANFESQAILYYDPNSGNSTVTFFNAKNGGPNPPTPPNACPGAFLLVTNDHFAAAPGVKPPFIGFLTGRVFRLGQQVPLTSVPGPVASCPSYLDNSGETFYLQPGYDSLSDLYYDQANPPAPNGAPTEPWGGGGPGLFTGAGGGPGIEFFLIGRAPVLSSNGVPNDYSGPYTGPNQDIGVTSAYIRLNTSNN
jgi:hypothetical protein